jgi:hypothetical protein
MESGLKKNMDQIEVDITDIESLKNALMRFGGHYDGYSARCRTYLNGSGGNYGYYDEPCDCGWDEVFSDILVALMTLAIYNYCVQIVMVKFIEK